MITTKWNNGTMFEELDDSMIRSQQTERLNEELKIIFLKETNINSGFEN